MGTGDTNLDIRPAEWPLPAAWKVSERGKEAIRISVSMSNVKHGMYASVPMVCKEGECPYVQTCPLYEMDMAPQGERCPIEIAEIMKMYEEYNQELDVEDSRVDLTLLKELIDIEITLLRTENILAVDNEIIKDVAAGINPKGQIITKPEINKAYDLKDKLSRRKHEILRLFHSTRKDKAKDESRSIDPSTYASELLQRKQAIDAEFSIVEDKEKE